MCPQKISVNLRDVPETLLWPLHSRATESTKPNGLLHDPKAVSIAESIDYPYSERFGSQDHIHVLRALRFDEQIRLFLKKFPEATVVALGDGLETQFWRVDNGRVKWLAVDLAESIEVRRRFLPDSARHRNLVCSALDLRWRNEVDASKGVLITAQGLLMYFEPEQVRELIAACARAFPGGWMLFDVIPRWYSEETLRGYQKTRNYQTPKMPWGLNADEISSIQSFDPNVASVDRIPWGRGRGFVFGFKLPLLRSLGLLGKGETSFVRLRFRRGPVV